MNNVKWKRHVILTVILFLMLLLFSCAQAEVNAKDIEWETAKSLGWIDDTAQPDEACGKSTL